MKTNNFKFNPNRSVASHCPCGLSNHDGKFSPFFGYTDKGHCFSCGENFFPKDNANTNVRSINMKILSNVEDLKPSFIEERSLKYSLSNYEYNALYFFLVKLIGKTKAEYIAKEYQLGTSLQKGGSTVFWLIDVNGQVRSGKIIHYEISEDASSSVGLNCNRNKEIIPPITWVHKLIGGKNFNFKNCFFGEHLLNKYSDKVVAIVESEKSAVIAAAYFPKYIWLASGGVNGLTNNKISVLRNRNVLLFPDLKKYDEWKNVAKQIRALVPNCKVKVSDILEHGTTDAERRKGYDLADFLIREDYTTFLDPDDS